MNQIDVLDCPQWSRVANNTIFQALCLGDGSGHSVGGDLGIIKKNDLSMPYKVLAQPLEKWIASVRVTGYHDNDHHCDNETQLFSYYTQTSG